MSVHNNYCIWNSSKSTNIASLLEICGTYSNCLRRSIPEFCGDIEKKSWLFEEKIYLTLYNVMFTIICIDDNYYKNDENSSNNITRSRDDKEALLRLARHCGSYRRYEYIGSHCIFSDSSMTPDSSRQMLNKMQ